MASKFYLFLILILLQTIDHTSSLQPEKFKDEIISKFLKVNQIQSSDWDKLCEHLATMMITSNSIKYNTIHVTVHGVFLKEMWSKYDGFIQSLLKHSQGRIIINLVDIYDQGNPGPNQDFSIFLMHDEIDNYDSFLKSFLMHCLNDESNKVFAILSSNHTTYPLILVYNNLGSLLVYNFYLVHWQRPDTFELYRIKFEKQNGYVVLPVTTTKDRKFLVAKEVLNGDEFQVKVVFYDNFPLSYVHKDKIIGADGNVVEEFTKKLHTKYRVVNNSTVSPNLQHIYNDVINKADINLYSKADYHAAVKLTKVMLYNEDGLCLLAPRNIPVSAYDNLSLPLDKETLALVFVSTLSVIICWRLITREMSLSSILIAVYEISFNLGASDIENVSFRENILAYSLIFSSFFMVSFYESIFLSFMLVEPSLRSAYSLEELNQSSTKFYSFYDEQAALRSQLPIIKTKLIVNPVTFYGSVKLEIPENFDPNMAYLLFCESASLFASSPRNFQGTKQLFDVMSITKGYSTYNVRQSYFYIDEFRSLISKLMESGIYKFWKESEYKHLVLKESAGSELDSYDMTVPLVIVLIGGFLSFFAFLTEIVWYRYGDRIMRLLSIISSRVHVQAKKRKINFKKWRLKFFYKKPKSVKIQEKFLKIKIDLEKLSGRNDKEFVKSRESVKGGYLVFEKFKLKRKARKTKPKIVQVAPCQPGGSQESRV